MSVLPVGHERALAVAAPMVLSGVGADCGAGSRARKTARWLGVRANRVALLVLLIAVLSLADLFMTMEHLRGVGMSEANPIARMVMSYNSPAILVSWKLATILLTSLIFLMARTRRLAEIGCCVCLCALVWLTVRWLNYSDEIARATPAVHALAQFESDTWVRFE